MIDKILLLQSVKGNITIHHINNCLFIECYSSLLQVNIRDFFKGFTAGKEYLLRKNLYISEKISGNFSKFSVAQYNPQTIVSVLEKIFNKDFLYKELEDGTL